MFSVKLNASVSLEAYLLNRREAENYNIFSLEAMAQSTARALLRSSENTWTHSPLRLAVLSCKIVPTCPESLLLLQSWIEPSREGQDYRRAFLLALCYWFRTARIFQRSRTLSPSPIWTPAMSKISDASRWLSLAKWSRSSRLHLVRKRVQLAQS